MVKEGHRELNDDEKKLYAKQLERLRGELEYNEYLHSYNTLMVDKGLKQNYLLQLSEKRNQQRAAAEAVLKLRATINSMMSHLEYGVPPKPEAATEGETDE